MAGVVAAGGGGSAPWFRDQSSASELAAYTENSNGLTTETQHHHHIDHGNAQLCDHVTGQELGFHRERAVSSVGVMSSSHFLRIEREGRGESRHTVVHLADPKFSVELTPDRDAPDRMGKGVIKRVVVPNSWAGDYARYGKFISAAQDFFAATQAGAVAPRRG